MTDTQLPPPPPDGSVPTRADYVPVRPLAKPSAIEGAWVGASLLVGLAADLAIRRPPWNNVATTLLVLAVGIGLGVAGQLKTRTSVILVSLAVLSGLFLSLRSDPRLLVANVAVIVTMYLAAVLHSQGRSMWDLRPLMFAGGVLGCLEGFVFNAAEAPQEAQARARESGLGWQRSLAILRGAAIAAPILILLGVLLASADQVFASFFGIDFINGWSMLSHLTLFVLGAASFAAIIRFAVGRAATPTSESTLSLGRVEATVLLVGLNMLFSAFVFAQVWAKSSAGVAVLADSQLQYKDYARQGFFQLLWVAGITLVVLMGVHVATRAVSSAQVRLRRLSLLTVALTLVIVGVALHRLSLYVGDNGLTPLRFYSLSFAAWIGLAFCVVAVRLSGYAASRHWLTTALGATGLLAVMTLNLVNPESIIVANNLSRPGSSAITYHVDGLSGDGLADLAENVSQFDANVASRLTQRLCTISASRSVDEVADGWLDYNLGESRANRALNILCS